MGIAHQTSTLARTSSTELTERVILFTVCCQRGLFQQGFIGTEAGVFYDTSRQRVMMCDLVSTKKRARTSCCQVTRPCSGGSAAACTVQIKVICPLERKYSVWVGRASPLHPRHEHPQEHHLDIFRLFFLTASGRNHGLRTLAPGVSLTFVYREPAGRVIIVSAALMAAEEVARSSPESVPEDRG